ncbi:hypothetical protein A2U01_0112288, partial [Trifolium medium]|nr:hypothetical protein [Trifolium medium]
MNLRDAQKSETSCVEPLMIGATRHTSRRDAQLTEPPPSSYQTWRNAP